MTAFIWNTLSFIVALGLLVAIHEFGHFWVARRCGVRVERFSIGFGKQLWRKQGGDGTEYAVAMIPLGGYVKMLDARIDEVPPELAHRTFDSKKPLAKMAIVAAGPAANFIFAFFALWLMYLIGIPGVKPIVGQVTPGSFVEQSGLQPGSEIVQVDHRKVKDWEGVQLSLFEHIGSDRVDVTVRPEGSDALRTHTLELSNWDFNPDSMPLLGSLGFEPVRPETTMELAQISGSGAGAEGGMEVGDRIVRVQGAEMAIWQDFVEVVQGSPDQPLAIQVERDGQLVDLQVTPEGRSVGERMIGFLGVSPKAEPLPDNYLINLQYGPIDALVKGIERTAQLTTLTFDMIGKLLTGVVSVDNLSGPISIAQGAGTSAGYGLVYFLSFLALISVNLGIINLFPLPILDGGHLVFHFFEWVTGKPVPEKIQEVSFRVGAALLMVLMGIAIFNDFSRLL